MRPWVDVAYLAKTRNLDGSFVVKATTGLPFLLEEGMEVAFVPPQTDCPRRVHVEHIRLVDDESAEVKFDAVNDSDVAHQLLGCHCLARRAELDEELLNAAPVKWQGWTVVDAERGLLGSVSDIIENPGQDLLEVDRGGDAADPLLIPVVEEFIIDVDPDNLCITVDVPQGLLEL